MDTKRRNILLVYIISLGASGVLTWVMWAFGKGSLTWTTVIFFSGTRFLAGFGLFLSLTSGAIFILTKFGDKFKANRKRLLLFNWGFLIILPFVLMIYYFVKIFLAYQAGTNPSSTPATFQGLVENWLDIVLFIEGIVSLLLSLYILPAISEKIVDVTETTTSDKLARGAKNVGRGLKKRYFKWRKDYAKALVQDALTLKEIGNVMRQRLAIIMLPIFALGTLLFTPIAVVCAVFFVQLLWDSDSVEKPERILLAIAMIGTAVITTLSPFPQFATLNPFYAQYKNLAWILTLTYFCGLVVSSLFLIRKLLILEGYKLSEQLQKAKEFFVGKKEGKKSKTQDMKEKRQEKKQTKAKAKEDAEESSDSDESAADNSRE
ncbi:MAG TPA: hypothetical protein VKK79_12580 [Candidatus Lokiarchaeia archaeon]|nr:hypothetical protein [Candidatus Lokiarchaeia archaeon]